MPSNFSRTARSPTSAITDELIWQILRASAAAAKLKKNLSPQWLRHAHGSHAHRRGAPAAIRDALGRALLSTTDLFLFGTDGRIESLPEILGRALVASICGRFLPSA